MAGIINLSDDQGDILVSADKMKDPRIVVVAADLGRDDPQAISDDDDMQSRWKEKTWKAIHQVLDHGTSPAPVQTVIRGLENIRHECDHARQAPPKRLPDLPIHGELQH